MQIEKQEIVKIMDDFGNKVAEGDVVVMDTTYGLIIGRFKGINKSGAMCFVSPFKDIDKQMCLRPASIRKMKWLNIDFC